ncbi:hypothetical protein F5Y03DRAFT_350011 [Xylaria venustula]|nr:hypothetical protein F5Y03DRAFT_350011 [Xylaria venustula]
MIMDQNTSTTNTAQRRAELQHAIGNGDWHAVERSILAQDPGSLINCRFENGLTPLMYAMEKNYSRPDFLLVKGADPDAIDPYGQTSLHAAALKYPVDSALKLICYGADINAVTKDQKTALAIAIERGEPDLVAQLIEHGAGIGYTISEQQAISKLSKNHEIRRLLESHPRPSRRRLIVCCDGTWQDNDTEDPLSNVARIAMCISSDDPDPRLSDNYPDPEASSNDQRHPAPFTQILHYQSGVGTGAFAVENLYEGIFASAISEDIRDTYGFICDNFTGHGDEIILIGYSRGAFTVRAVAALVHDIGVLRGAGRYCLSRLYDLWEKQMPNVSLNGLRQPIRQPDQKKSREKLELHCYVQNLMANKLTRKGVRIKVCATWDTVSALGLKLPRWLPQIPYHKLAFVDSKLCPNIMLGFQALALDERRFHFQPNVWVEHNKEKQRLKQCWFRGSHGDVGGGVSNFGLANLSLAWMISQLDGHVKFEKSKILHLEPNLTLLPALLSEQPTRGQAILGEQSFRVYDTMSFLYKLAGSEIRKPGKYAPDTETVHFSVFALSDPDRSQVITIKQLDDMREREEEALQLEKTILHEWWKRDSSTKGGLEKLRVYLGEEWS